MNVGILAYGLWFLVRLGWLSRRISLLATSTIVFAYAYLTGAEPPILRAAVLVGSVCCAKYLGRRGIDFNTLALAGVFVLCVNPSYVFQIGTQLSFLAVGVLASIGPRITERLRPVQTPLHRLIESTESRPRRWTRSLLRETVTVCLSSLAVWIVTTPLVWYRFQLISPSALILNPAAWIPIATAMYSGFGILLLGEICGWLGNVLGIICHWSLIAITGLIGTALEWPGNHVFLPGPPLWWTVLFYVGCAARQVLSSARLRLRWTGAIVLVWIAGAVWLSPAGVRISCPRNYLRITFLAVGHGGAVVVEFADGSVLLYDCGRMAAPGLAHRTTAGFLASQGITHLDAVVVSHADTDHFNGLPALMQRVSIGALYLSQQMERQPSASVQILRVAAKGAGIRQQTLQLGDTLVSPSGTRVRVLHPPPSQSEREYRSSNDNSNSIVLEISHQGKRLLLTGDLEKDGLERLLSHFAGDYSIVLIPHHGSVRSNPQRFSEWSGATWGVICGDDSNDVRRTMQIYESQGVIPLHTQDQGAIQFEIREDRISVTSFGQHQCPLF